MPERLTPSQVRRIHALIDRIRLERVPDFRDGVFEVDVMGAPDALVVSGQTTDPGAIDALLAGLVHLQLRVRSDDVVRLPGPAVGMARQALISTAIAPVYAEPRLPAALISQLVMGMRVEVLARIGDWLRVRGEDGYLGWVFAGYTRTGNRAWAFAWERGEGGEPVVSIDAELVAEDGAPVARLPWGSRVIRRSGGFDLPDGRRGLLASGEVVDVDRLADRFPPRGESVARTARRWLGAPYLWGGVTRAGVDCSGFAQAVLWMHGIALPRDSDLQASVGSAVLTGADIDLRAGDLAFFREEGERISHVAIALGGSLIIHSAITNGCVAENDLAGESDFEQRLRGMLVQVRRILPD